MSVYARCWGSLLEDSQAPFLIDKQLSFTAVKETGRLWTYFNTQCTPSFRLLHNGFLIWESEINYTDPIPVRMVERLVASQR